MNLANVTHATLSKDLDREVPEVYVVIAKHKAAGVTNESLAEIIGCTKEEIEEVESDDLYKSVRQIIGAMIASQNADQGIIWDSLESIAAKRLLDRIEMERDPEFLLKVASVANRMTRRNKPAAGVLDPSTAGRVALTLTSRMVERITQQGHTTVVEEKRLSIHDGSMATPHFDEINEILTVRPGGLTPARVPIQDEGVSMDRLDSLMKEKFG